MANTPIEARWHPGQTLTADLVGADDSSWATGLSATELTNGKGRYRVTYTGTNTGHATLHLKSGSDYVTPYDGFDYDIEDVIAVQYPLSVTRLLAFSALMNAQVLDVINVDTLVAGVTIPESLRRIGALTSGIVTGAGTGTETFKDYAESASTIVITVDASGNRSAITYN